VAIVSDEAGAHPGAPLIRRVQTEPGGVVVVGLTGQQGRVRFERVD
jgi:hypothetical protein